jgi:phosphatidylserine/phosphatidylglycerophosphate/cardiolipin synthase-like enzyme
MSENRQSIREGTAVLVEALSRLDVSQLRDLASSEPGDPAGNVSAGRLKRAMLVSTSDATRLARRFNDTITGSGLSWRDVVLVIEALAHARTQAAAGCEVEIVCTAPERFGLPLRTTYATALQMIREASKGIVVVGYVFTEGAKNLIYELARAARERSARITVVGNRIREQLPLFKAAWPAGLTLPRVFSRKADVNDPMAALHAKLLVCDRASALVTSANFTYHGLHANIEIGVRVRAEAVQHLIEFIEAMISSGDVAAVETLP